MRGKLAIWGITVALGLLPSVADAQWLATDDRPEMIVLTTGTSSAVVVGLVVLTVASVRKEPRALGLYLRANEPAVRASLAMGAGTAIEDLAELLGLHHKHVANLGLAVRRRRTELLRAAYVDQDATQFAAIIASAIR